MKVTIIGTNGFLSSSIAKYALEKGWEICMYGIKEPTHPYTSYSYINLIKEEIDVNLFIESDLVIYGAGAGIQSKLNESTDIIYELNSFVPIKICNNLRSNNFKGVFITFGSYFELGESNVKKPVNELEIINATNTAPTDYIVSKRLLTRFVTSYKHDFVHWHFILPTIYGPTEDSYRLIPYTINSIRNNIKLHLTSGKQIRQYLFIDDVFKYIDSAIIHALPSGIYNLAVENIFTIRTLIDCISKIMKVKLDDDIYGIEERNDIGMTYLALDGTQLERYIGKIDLTKFDDSLHKYLL